MAEVTQDVDTGTAVGTVLVDRLTGLMVLFVMAFGCFAVQCWIAATGNRLLDCSHLAGWSCRFVGSFAGGLFYVALPHSGSAGCLQS